MSLHNPVGVICIGSAVYLYPSGAVSPTRSMLPMKHVVLANQMKKDDFLQPQCLVPPYLHFVLLHNKIMRLDIFTDIVDSFRYDGDKVTGIPWTYILYLANLITQGRGETCVTFMCCGSVKVLLRNKICSEKKRRKLTPLAELKLGKTHFYCQCHNHKIYTGKCSTLLLPADIDDLFYSVQAKIFCTWCAETTRSMSHDGFFDATLARAVFAQQDLLIEQHILVAALQAIFATPKSHLLYYRFAVLSKVVSECAMALNKENVLRGLFTGLMCPRRLGQSLKVATNHLGMVSESLLNEIIYFAINYRLFGVLPARNSHPLTQQVTLALPMYEVRLKDRFECVMISLFNKDGIFSLFRDPKRKTFGDVHVYMDSMYKLEIAGVHSISLTALPKYLEENINHSVIVWPAQFFTAAQIHMLAQLKTAARIILAGTPFVMDEQIAMYGQPFTDFLERDKPDRFYGSNDTSPLIQLLDTFAGHYIPVTHFALNTVQKYHNLTCPSVFVDSVECYNRYVLTTLLYYKFKKPFKYIAVKVDLTPPMTSYLNRLFSSV